MFSCIVSFKSFFGGDRSYFTVTKYRKIYLVKWSEAERAGVLWNIRTKANTSFIRLDFYAIEV